ncbi:ATP-binding response regulator [Dokdonella fugitiva]|uniref:histidine kinase n=1 Tax=Dokdonella fugitiva TaxID=328517 RepID=A0A4R2IG78_9GAMM|nr:response regulator [Dokdonella fugitiva]TCO43216.1 signal transduction histidine kinase [Dokdonella fugitiva]
MADASPALRVLLVEDSELDAELVLDQLRDDGLEVDWRRVEDEAGFAGALATFTPDIVLSDLSMPEFSGYRALDIARDTAPRVPFLFVSGTIGEDAAVEALRRGATDYVLKDNLARLASAVRRALAEAEDKRARDAAEAELLRVQRYESLALLASGLSHDLRNVLQPIAMGVAMLRDDPNEEIRKIGRLIGESTQRGLDIVASMLSFARGSRAAAHRMSIASLIDGLAMLLRGSLASDVQFVVDAPERALEIEGNATELQQCLLNLCLNGAQAMPAGGTLRVTVRPLLLDESFFEAGESARPGRFLCIAISDTGIGMSKDVRDRLFKPFFTTKEKGTGLGLLSCQRILANHGGVIRVESEPGKGSTFSLYVPMPAAGADAGGPAAIERGHGERVLVVIERESKLVMLQDIIESSGYAVTAADNGAVAMQSIERDGLPDVVLMDGRMTLMTGVMTASHLLERDYRGPLILIAAPAERAAIEPDLPPLPRIRFIDRPVDPDQLLAVLAEEVRAR